MMRRPGSFLWLVAHDLRLNWRGLTDVFKGSSSQRIAMLLLAAAAVLHLLAWPAVRWLAPVFDGGSKGAVQLAAVVGAIFTWMTAQSVFSATRALYDRAVLDLLLSSPLPAVRVVSAKCLAIMASTLGSIALLALPIADMGAATDGPQWLGVYPALVALALIATSIGLAITMGLFMLVGPRRARLYSHMTGAGIGGAFVLGAQIYAVLSVPVRTALTAWFDKSGLIPHGFMSNVSSLPLGALHGQLSAMGWLLIAGFAFFAATTGFLGERFAAAAIAAAGAPAPGDEANGVPSALRFRTGVSRNLRHKEWRLMLRDPSFFAQLSLQIIYTIPIAVVLLRSHLVPTAFALVPTIVVIAGQVAGSIAWITVSGEDAPELIASAPVTPAAVNRDKLSAVALPVFVIVALPLAGLAATSWRMAAVALLFAAGASASTALLNFWHPMPGNRRGMLRRHSQSKLIGLVEHGLAMLWAFAVVFALIGSKFALVPLAIVAGLLMFSSRAQPFSWLKAIASGSALT